MTRPSIISLSDTNLVPQHVPWVTPRVLNRQVKAVMDDLMQRETQHVFDLFSKSLKPKSRREWAPCLAAFLALCLFMESVETAADNFVVAQNEIGLRGGGGDAGQRRYERSFALGVNEEIEKMPFSQFAFQFHQVYQTHSRDASTRAFNPLVDDELLEGGELDEAGLGLVEGLRGLIEGPSCECSSFVSCSSCPRLFFNEGVLTDKRRERAGLPHHGPRPAEPGEPPVPAGRGGQLHGEAGLAVPPVLYGREVHLRPGVSCLGSTRVDGTLCIWKRSLGWEDFYTAFGTCKPSQYE